MKSPNRPKPTRATEARRTAAVLALVSSGTVAEAAELAGIGRTTIFNYLNDPAFLADLNRARAAAFVGGLNALRGAVERAVNVLAGLLGSRSEAIRKQAAVAVIELALRAQEAQDLEARLSRLEEAIIEAKQTSARSFDFTARGSK